MWMLASAVVVSLKGAVARAHGRVRPEWLWGWPGMDPDRFHRAPACAPSAREIVGGVSSIGLGVLLLWGVVPHAGRGLGAAWIGLVAIGLVLHFGVLRLLSIYWRSRGFDAQPLFDNPLAARTLGEFWGRRWNRGFADVAGRWIYRPLVRRVGVRGAMFAVFAASGVLHDFLLSVPAGGGYGLCMLYFLIQGGGVLVERRARHRLLTVAVVLLPLPLLFHSVFMRAVMVPMLAAMEVLS
jgi:alginate O-acetyltransferase complex protein AlgI